MRRARSAGATCLSGSVAASEQGTQAATAWRDRSAGAGWVRQALAICGKDLRIEVRERTSLNAVLLFAVTSVVVTGAAVGTAAPDGALLAALLWIVLFFAAFSGLARAFVHEHELGTALALRLAARPGAVLAGKLLCNWAILAAVGVVAVPVCLVVLRVPVAHAGLFVGVLCAGLLGLGAAATMVSAIIARARSGGALFGAVGLPILLPQLFLAVHATKGTLAGGPGPEAAWDGLVGLLAFAAMLVTASVLVFPYVWED